MKYQISEARHLSEPSEPQHFEGSITGAKLFAESNRKMAGSTLRIHNNAGELVAWKIGKQRWKFAKWS